MSPAVLRVLKKQDRPLVGVTSIQIQYLDDIGFGCDARGWDGIGSENVPMVRVGKVWQPRTKGREERHSDEIVFGGCRRRRRRGLGGTLSGPQRKSAEEFAVS